MGESTLILFEDDAAGFFEPVALTRGVARLRVGVWTHRERWTRLFPECRVGTIVRGYLAESERASGDWDLVNEAPTGDSLFVAAAAGRQRENLDAIRALEAGQALLAGGGLLAFRTGVGETAGAVAALREWAGEEPLSTGARDGEAFARSLGLDPRDVPGRIPRTLVDLMTANAETIAADFPVYEPLMPAPSQADHPGVHFLAPERIRLAAGVRLDPGVVLDARQGPVLIGPGSEVHANSVVQGPVAMGADCRVKPLSRVMDGVSLGPTCRVGGEVDATIIQGFSNKQHDGFLGHSYLGSWVNLGAATDTSDLKNDYGLVTAMIAGQAVETGTRGVGSLIGDHTKTAIHTSLNTGTVIGVSCNVFGAGFPPRAIPSFSWGGGAEWREYIVDKAIRVARVVTGRRQVEFGAAEEALLRHVHAQTAAARLRVLGTPARV